jgi:hypothetical protein
MWGLLFDSGSSILNVSIRTISGSLVAIFILLLLATVFKRHEDVRQYIFVVILAVIFLTSTLLFMTALVHLQNIGVLG